MAARKRVFKSRLKIFRTLAEEFWAANAVQFGRLELKYIYICISVS